VLAAAYPWIARRLLTEQAPELRETLRALLYTGPACQFHRLESRLRQAARSPPRAGPAAGGGAPGGAPRRPAAVDDIGHVTDGALRVAAEILETRNRRQAARRLGLLLSARGAARDHASDFMAKPRVAALWQAARRWSCC